MNKEQIKKLILEDEGCLDGIVDIIMENYTEEGKSKASSMEKYFVPGQPFEVWNDCSERGLVYYNSHNDGVPLFVEMKKSVGPSAMGCPYDNYHPIGTIWDQLTTPTWVEWIATDASGAVFGYGTRPYFAEYRWNSLKGREIQLGEISHCESPDDWKESLEQRPDWAK